MPRKRFQFNNLYLYGSLAFVVGFGGIMAMLVHTTPMYAPQATIAGVVDQKAHQEAATQPVETNENDATNEPATTAPAPQNTSPAVVPQEPSQNKPALQTTPPPAEAAPEQDTTKDSLVIDLLPLDLITVEVPLLNTQVSL